MTACGNDKTSTQDPITLTTPKVEWSTESPVQTAGFNLWMLNDNYEVEGDGTDYGKYSYNQTGGWSEPTGAPVVTDGAGRYLAGITGTAGFDATATLPAISNVRYGYRGYVTVAEDGTFTLDTALQSFTAAVQVKLKDADGAEITDGDYQYSFDGLYWSASYWSEKEFPIGSADAVMLSMVNDALFPVAQVNGGYTPGTYPGKLEPLEAEDAAGYTRMVPYAPTEPWKLFTVKSGTTTWTVNHPAETLTLEAGKLYTFTVTLGGESVITLSGEDVSGTAL